MLTRVALRPPMQVQACAYQCEKTKGCSIFAYGKNSDHEGRGCYWQYTQRPGVCSHLVYSSGYDLYALNG